MRRHTLRSEKTHENEYKIRAALGGSLAHRSGIVGSGASAQVRARSAQCTHTQLRTATVGRSGEMVWFEWPCVHVVVREMFFKKTKRNALTKSESVKYLYT